MDAIKRIIAMLLTFSMLFSTFTFISYAEETGVDGIEISSEFEDDDLETEKNYFDDSDEFDSLNSVQNEETENVNTIEIEDQISNETEQSPNDENADNTKISEDTNVSDEDSNDTDTEHETDSETVSDKISDEYDEIISDGSDEDSIEEAELMIDWLYKDRVVEIAANGAVARKEAKSSAKIMKTYSVGDYVKIVDKIMFSEWYKTNEGYWIYGSNFRTHTHRGQSSSTAVWYEQKNKEKHVCHEDTPAVICKCGETVSKKKSTSKTEKHSFNSVGRCTKCGYTYEYSIKSFDSTMYTTKQAVTLRKSPYDAAASAGTLDAGKLRVIVGEVKNAFGDKWFVTSNGTFIYSKNVSKHSHSYDDYTGCCSCGAEKPYSVASTKGVERYEVKSDVYIKRKPFSGAAEEKFVSNGTVLQVNGYTYSSFLWIKTPSWYRTIDGYWVQVSDVKEHKHTYSGGICKSPGCGEEYTLKTEPIKNQGSAVQYETMSDNVAVRVAPYNNRQVKSRIAKKGSLVLINAKAENSNGSIWYKTTDGYWIYSMDIVEHQHTIVAGSCQNSNCTFSYAINPITINEKTYVPSINKIQSYKLPYFDSTVVRVYQNQCIYFNINAEFTNNKGERWYRSNKGEWFYFDSLRAHTHTYKYGVCDACGAEEPIQITAVTATAYQTTKTNTVVYKKPYATDSNKLKTLKAKGTTMSVLGKTWSGDGQLWFLTSESYWVKYSDVTKSLLVNYGNSTSTSKEKFVLHVVNSDKKGIANATVSFGTQSGTTNAQGYVELGYQKNSSTLKVTASDYEDLVRNNYIMSDLRTDTVLLSKVTVPEITSAVLERNNEATDVVHTEVILNQASNGLRFNLTVSSNVKDVKEYRLVQNDKVRATSKDGKFTNLVADDFTRNVTVSAQVVSSDGTVKTTRKLLISVIYKAGDLPDTLSLGKNINIKLSEDLPFPFAGASVDVAVPTLPLDVEINEEHLRVGINFKLADSLNESKDKETRWEYIKRLNKNKFNDFYAKNAIIRSDDAINPEDPFGFKLEVGGYVEGSVSNSYFKGKLFIALKCHKRKEYQLVVSPPIVGEIEFNGSVQADGTIQISKLGFSGDLSVSVNANIGVYAGVGVKGLASIGVYGKGSTTANIAILPQAYFDSLSVTANIGVKAKLFGRDICNVKLLQFGDYYLYRRGATLDGIEDVEYCDLNDIISDIDNYKSMDRSYLEERSGWYEPEAELLEGESVAISQFDFETLQSNTYTDIRPQVAATEDTIMMAYLDDNADRDDDNRTMLVCSLYNTDTEKWSEPVAVYDNDMADFNFNLVSNGEAIYIVWQKATSLITSEMNVTDISKNTELYIAKFDEAMGSFQNIEQVTKDNETYEMMPRVSSVNGKTIVAWFENSDDDVYGQKGFNKIHYAVKLDKDYAPGPESDISEDEFLPADNVLDTPVEVDSDMITDSKRVIGEWSVYDVDKDLPAITSLSVGYMLDDGYIAFTTDEDKDYSTVDDQKVYLVSAATNEVILYTDKAMNVEFVKVHGDNAMTWYNQGYIYYTYSPDYAPQMIYSDSGIPCDEYHILSADSGDMAILYTIKGNNQSDAYVILYDDSTFEWGLPIQVTKQDKYIQNFNGAYYDEMIVSIFNNTDVNTETLFEKNDLCCAIIGERYDLMIGNVIFEDLELEPEKEYPLKIEVKNNGTRRVSGFKLTVSNQGTVIDEKNVTASIKPGETYTVETSLIMPEEVEPSVYTIELDHETVADGDISNNTYDLQIGKASLFTEVSTAVEDGKNIFYISVLNKGYTPSSGSIVLYDENFAVVKTLVENIDEIGYYETYNCTVELDSDVFDGEMYKSFFIGVVPTADQYVSDYNATSVYLKNAVLSDDAKIDISQVNLNEASLNDAGLMDTYSKTISGNISNENENIIDNAKLSVMAFASGGIYIETQFQSVTLNPGESTEFSFEFDTDYEIDTVKVSIIDSVTLEPLTDFTEISLYDDEINNVYTDEEEEWYKEVLDVEEEY